MFQCSAFVGTDFVLANGLFFARLVHIGIQPSYVESRSLLNDHGNHTTGYESRPQPSG
jgi:hypothetical protein